jgi:NAD(P)-dependent dehydrogenase (short-subunit alcohol dehydrogenase family)
MATAIITGGNLGLGFETAKWIAKNLNWTVVLACRSLERGEEAAQKIRKDTGNNKVFVRLLDLGSMKSIRKFREVYDNDKTLPVLRALVCNAGLQVLNPAKTEDGFESTFGINHLGHFQLTNLLLKKRVLDKTPLRVVFVASGTHDPKQKTGLPHPNYTSAKDIAYLKPVDQEQYNGRLNYTRSKLCNVLCAYEMNRQLAKLGISHVAVNAFDPGLMPGTGLAREYNAVFRLLWRFVLPVLTYIVPNTNTVSASGTNLGSIAVSEKYEGVTGKYFEGQKQIDSSEESYDENKARDLWSSSLELCKSTSNDSLFFN